MASRSIGTKGANGRMKKLMRPENIHYNEITATFQGAQSHTADLIAFLHGRRIIRWVSNFEIFHESFALFVVLLLGVRYNCVMYEV